LDHLSHFQEGFIVASCLAGIVRLTVRKVTHRSWSPFDLLFDLLCCALYGGAGGVLHSALVDSPRIAPFLAVHPILALLTGIQAWAEPLIGRLLSEGSDSQRDLDLYVAALRKESPLDSEGRAEQTRKTAREAIARPSSADEKPAPYEQLPLWLDGDESENDT